MPAGENSGQNLLDHHRLANDGFAQLVHHLLAGGSKLLQILAYAVLAHA